MSWIVRRLVRDRLLRAGAGQRPDLHLGELGLVSIPLSFLLGVVGTYVGARHAVDQAKFAEMEVRSLTGAGSEKAVAH